MTKPYRCVRSLKDAKAWVRMHGAKRLVHLRLKAVDGIIEAKGIRKLLAKKEKNQQWKVERIEQLDPLVEIHDAIEAARKLIEKLLCAIATTDVPPSGLIATTDVPPSGRIARVIPLNLATQLRDAGTRLREQQLGNASVRELVQPLGTQIETLGRALVEVVRTPLAEAQNPLPNLRDDLLVAKRNLYLVWGTRIRIHREG